MFRFVVEQSDDVEYADALDAALGDCLEKLGDDACGAAVLFSSVPGSGHRGICERLSAALGPEVPLIGGTTDGELSSELGYAEESVVLGLFSSDMVQFSSGFSQNLSSDPFRAVNNALDHALDGLGTTPRLCVLVTDGLKGGGPAALETVNDRLGPEVTVVGCTSGDCFGEGRTWQFGTGRAETDSVSLLLLGGRLRLGVAVDSGWTPAGPARTVTSAQGNVVRRIGDATALEHYRYYLGDVLPHILPFALSEERGNARILRAPLSFDPDDGSVRFAAPVREGAQVRMTEMVRDEIIDAAVHSVRVARSRFGAEPGAALVFSCSFRRQVLGTRSQEEADVLGAGLPAQTPSLGLYTYGEFAPMDGHGPGLFHNCSFVTLLLGEEEP